MSKGTAEAQWKPGVAMSVPTKEQVTHLKRLLLSNLELHLRHYVYKPLYTIIITGGMNRDMSRLRLFQSMCVSRFSSENDLGRAMAYLAQRWCGASTPVNMLHTDDLQLLLPLNGAAPQAAPMFYEL